MLITLALHANYTLMDHNYAKCNRDDCKKCKRKRVRHANRVIKND